MSSVEINTSQNVIIQYDLGALRERIFAFALDFLILIVGIAILWFLFLLCFNGIHWMLNFGYIIFVFIFLFYGLVSEALMNGQTLGKKALNIKVMRLDGKELVVNDYFTRWAFRLIDIYMSFGSVASILIGSSEKNQRLGDVLANCVVIKLKPTLALRLEDIINIRTLNDYKPQYPLVIKFTEEEMLIVKSVIDRAKKYQNQVHNNLLVDVTRRVADVVGVDVLPLNKEAFLTTIIKDYIVLTR